VDYIAVAIAIAGAVFYYKAAEHENQSRLAWTGFSLVISVALMFVFHAGYFALVAGQVSLLLLIALWRMWRQNDAGEPKS
jgi:hypothetical protein